MSVIFLLIPLSILIAACFLVAFIWAVRSGQFEDTYTPSLRILWEDPGTKPKEPDSAPAPAAAPEAPNPAQDKE